MAGRIRNFNKDSEIIKGLIYSTIYLKNSYDKYRKGKLYEIFSAADLDYIRNGTYVDVLENEHKLIKEYQSYPYCQYCEGRLKFLANFEKKYHGTNTMLMIRDFLTSYRPRIGVYPGSFNSFHVGHMDILEQAEKVFDKVIIAIGRNPSKSQEQIGWGVKDVLPLHEVVQYTSLLPDYLRTLSYADVTLIRGLRNGYDLQYEMNQLRYLEDYGCNIPVIYLICKKEFAHISSSDIRGLITFSPSSTTRYMPTKYNYII